MYENTAKRKQFDRLHVSLIIILVVVLIAVAGYFLIKVYLLPSAFKPVELNAKEEKILQTKLDRLDFSDQDPAHSPSAVFPGSSDITSLEPEAYSEADADRTIRFTERELNALLAKNTDLADKVAIDLSRDLISAKILVPVDDNFPVLGGIILRIKTGVTFSYTDGRPVVMLRGVSLIGVPLPNAWLGNMKNIDVIREYGGTPGFWKAFADGISDVRVEEGLLTVMLRE